MVSFPDRIKARCFFSAISGSGATSVWNGAKDVSSSNAFEWSNGGDTAYVYINWEISNPDTYLYDCRLCLHANYDSQGVEVAGG